MNPLEQEICTRIERDGPITFRNFMELALYHPTHGYYNREDMDIGKGGDFYTAANVHRLYGETLAVKMLELWRSLDAPGPVTVIEIGAGTGQTARDILATLASADVRYLIVEKSPALKRRQQDVLADFGRSVDWVAIDDISAPGIAAIILQSEVIDAFPVHRVQYANGALQELYVDCASDALVEKLGPVSDSLIVDYWRKYCPGLPEGARTEINLDAPDWMRALGRVLERGYVVTIDYGMSAGELYSDRRPQGTVVCYREHRLCEDPLEQVGRQDITAHVNFSALQDVGDEVGLHSFAFQSQANFLIDAGLLDRLALLEQAAETEAEKVKARQAVKRLVFPQGMGETFRVLVQQKV